MGTRCSSAPAPRRAWWCWTATGSWLCGARPSRWPGGWETPGGFCDGWEHPADAAVREGREELGVEVALGDFVGMYLGSYEYQSELLPVLDSFFTATLPSGQDVVLDARESSELAWFPVAGPPPLAFSTMDAAVREVARRWFGRAAQ